MKRKARLISSLLFLLTVLNLLACSQEPIKPPEIRNVSYAWGQVNFETIEVITSITVYNPNSISLPVKSAVCDIFLNDINVGSAEARGISLKQKAESVVRVSTKVNNAKIPDFWAEHINRGEKSTLKINGKVTFDLLVTGYDYPFEYEKTFETNILSKLQINNPVTIEKKVKLPIIGEFTYFKITLISLSSKWGIVTRESTQLILTAKIKNENDYTLPIPIIAYEFSANDLELSSGETDLDFKIEPDDEIEISETFNLNNSKMDDWLVSHIKSGEKSTFKIKIYVVFELPGSVAKLINQNRIRILIWEGSYDFETDLLGNKK